MDHRTEVRRLIATLYDDDTGLAGPALFYDQVQRALALARRRDLGMAIAIIEFAPQPGSDEPSLGEWLRHTQAFVEASRGQLRASDAVGALGRNTVGVLLADMREPFLPAVLERLLLSHRLEVERDDIRYHLAARIGVARPAEEMEDAADLVQAAWDDLAARQAAA